MIKYHSVNGEIFPIDQAQIGVTDLGLLRGYGIFDYFQIRNGNALFMEDHLHRFYRSAAKMQLDVPFEIEILKKKILELIEANGLDSCGIRIVLTGGYSSDGFTPSSPNLLILEHPLKVWDSKIYSEGTSLITAEFVRTMPEVKTTSYFVPILLSKKMKEAGATDVLYFDKQDWISETSRSNFFIISKAGKLITAGEGILKGITRMHTLEIAKEVIDVEERNINLSELENAREAFITSTTKGILPIIKIDDQLIGNGKPGEITQKLGQLLKNVKD